MNTANTTGRQTLEAISRADRFNRWMYDTIRPYCHGNLLEIGSGIGNISSFFVRSKFQITLSDVDQFYLQTLRKKFDGIKNVKEICSLDLEKDDFAIAYRDKQNSFDTIFLLNVLEHIRDDDAALRNCTYLLKKGGTLIILVPAYSWLYANLDKELDHYRRYTLRTLRNVFQQNQLAIKKQFYFNATGIVAWLYAKVFRLSAVPQIKMRQYDRIVPFAKLIDKIVFGKIGLSTITIGQK